jgi:hypothetical protein
MRDRRTRFSRAESLRPARVALLPAAVCAFAGRMAWLLHFFHDYFNPPDGFGDDYLRMIFLLFIRAVVNH